MPYPSASCTVFQRQVTSFLKVFKKMSELYSFVHIHKYVIFSLFIWQWTPRLKLWLLWRVHTGEQTSPWHVDCPSFGRTPGRELAGSHGRSIFSFILGNLFTVFYKSVLFSKTDGAGRHHAEQNRQRKACIMCSLSHGEVNTVNLKVEEYGIMLTGRHGQGEVG